MEPEHKALIVILAMLAALAVLTGVVYFHNGPAVDFQGSTAVATTAAPATRHTTTTASASTQTPTTRPPARSQRWAKPISLPGLPNLHKVADTLYRGAQPTAEGMRQLEKMGVKTVVSLRSLHSNAKVLEGTGLAHDEVPVHPWDIEDKHVARFLKIVTDKTRTPVFVHCQHGADRTGLMCAVYRVAVCGWAKEDALSEMTEGGFGYHELWINIPRYLRKMDVDAIKRQAATIGKGEAKP